MANELPEVLKKIKPAYPKLGVYSKPGTPLPMPPNTQRSNESAFPTDSPEREIDACEDDLWAKAIVEAAKGSTSTK